MNLPKLLIQTIVTIYLIHSTPEFKKDFYNNLFVQIAIFVPIACIPALIFKKMWFVDIAWPAGLTAIGLQLLFSFNQSNQTRQLMVAICYLFQGGRMFLGALALFLKGVWSIKKPDLPRYQYAVEQFKKKKMNVTVWCQIDILIQCHANIISLILPALISGLNKSESINKLEILGFALWFLCLYLENKADMQKNKWLKITPKEDRNIKVCDYGMWKWSRHPNYFFEWMVWNFQLFIALVNLMEYENLNATQKYVFLLLLVQIPFLMYNCLVYWTGAYPSEHFSVQKRPLYAKYQQRTPMFFPIQIVRLFSNKYNE